MKSNASPGQDNLAPEVYKMLPYPLVILYWHRFRERQGSLSTPDPLSWKFMEYTGIPKPGETQQIPSLDKLRWISKIPCGQKWYQRAIKHVLVSEIRPTHVWSFGFQKHKATTDITGLLRQLFWNADTYSGMSLFICCLDVRTAFDCMTHDLVARALEWHGVHPRTTLNILRELSDIKARLLLPGCEPSAYFDFLRGGKQGGVDTPALFTLVMEYILAPCTHRWANKSCPPYGIQCDGDNGTHITHMVWADN
eukprot:5704326-Pyramimonas_sp.AAC.1